MKPLTLLVNLSFTSTYLTERFSDVPDRILEGQGSWSRNGLLLYRGPTTEFHSVVVIIAFSLAYVRFRSYYIIGERVVTART